MRFEAHHLVHKAPHWLRRRWQDLDHLAIEALHRGLDLTARRAQREVDELLRALYEVHVRKLFECNQNIRRREAEVGEVRVWVQLRCDDALFPDERAYTCEDIALAVVVPLRHHRAV